MAYREQLLKVDMGSAGMLMQDGLSHWARTWEYPYTLHAIARFLKNREPRQRILDAACGYTPVPIALATIGHEVVGVDIDRSLPEVWANTRLAANAVPGGSLRFEYGDMEKLQIADATFDVGCSVSSLEHTPHPDIAVRELCRVVKKGGLIVLTCDLDATGKDGIGQAVFDAMLAELHRCSDYWNRPRWCHPADVLTWTNRERQTGNFLQSALHRYRRFFKTGGPDTTNFCIACVKR